MNDQANAREEVGVVCCLRQQGEGKIRLVLEDAAFSSESREAWLVTRLFTWRDYDESAFFNTEFSEGELADIGLALVTRLAALAASQNRG